MQQQQKLGNFIAKLQYLLSNPQYSEIICWDKSETMIDILCYEKMEKEIIPLYFRHSKYESFVRQLNLYGFKKIKINGRHRFTHPQLLKGDKLLSISSHKSGSVKKDEKEHVNDQLSHQKTSESAGNQANGSKQLSPTLNSITQGQNQITQVHPAQSGGANGCGIVRQDQSNFVSVYPQQFLNYWNMLMMHSSNQMGGYFIINPMQIQQ